MKLDTGDLFRLHGPAIYRRARRLLGTHEDAEEATQEIFVRVLRHADRFEGRSHVTTWLYEVTTNYCLNALRDRTSRARSFAANVEPRSERSGRPTSDALVEVRRLLARADQEQARAAIYVYVDGMSHEEAAELMMVSRRTVGNLLDRFRAWALETSGESAANADECPNPDLAGRKIVGGTDD